MVVASTPRVHCYVEGACSHTSSRKGQGFTRGFGFVGFDFSFGTVVLIFLVNILLLGIVSDVVALGLGLGLALRL